MQSGQIRVGRRIYQRSGQYNDPSYPGFESILCLTKSTAYGSLGPYCLVDENGVIMENKWQFSKVYERVPKTKEKKSRYDQTVIWEHPEEIHALKTSDGWEIRTTYTAWRRKGMKCQYAVRYPVGYGNMHKCLFSLAEDEKGEIIRKPLSYIEARKQIYVPEYQKLVVQKPQFAELQQKLRNGTNLLIIEVDGPHQESLQYYKDKYNVNDDFIERDTILATPENLKIMLEDPKHSYGHGYCLAAALLGIVL